MRVAVFSAKSYDRRFLDAAARDRHQLVHLEPRCDSATAILATGAKAVCAFVNDVLDAPTLGALRKLGVRMVALRCAGYNHVDLDAAKTLGIAVARVPAYSPHAVAEHAFALILALNRHLHRAYNRVRDGNFALDGLIGMDLHGRTLGVVGTGRIGGRVAAIARGFGMQVLASDPVRDPEVERLGVRYVDRDRLLADSDIVSLHCPLAKDTHHLIDGQRLATMRQGVMLINTSRGGLVDTRAVIAGLKSGRIGHLGLDVYEEEAALFFEDRSDGVITDDVFSRLLTFPNVVITGHQAFLTGDALTNIATTTMTNLDHFATGVGGPEFLVPPQP